MRTLRIEIAYDGAAYFGWQRQAGFVSIQEKLEDAVRAVTGEPAVVHGSGRTDTGVHALRQVAHFQSSSTLEPAILQRALNANLPADIVVRACAEAPAEFHARFDATAKRYLYLVQAALEPDPLLRNRCSWAPYRLQLGPMREAARFFLGTHDFRSFANVDKNPRDPVKTVSSFKIVQSKDRFLYIVEASGFLLHMVRIMVGTLIEVGRGKIDPGALPGMLEARDRKQAGPTAPAQGLYLLRVLYKKERGRD